jgi:uncharacterized membrane protein YkvA (DUF1232 family)
MGQFIDKMRGWIDTFAADVDVVKKVVESSKAPPEARAQAAASLSYLVTRMDLIPDWEETCGVIDDAMILRVAVSIAAEKGLGDLDASANAAVARLCNEVEVVSAFLGPVIYPKLKKYTLDLVGKEVRGRKPAAIVDDAKARAALYVEIDEELRRLPPAPMADPDGVERTIKNYLETKL